MYVAFISYLFGTMRRNMFNLSRCYMRSLFCKHDIKSNFSCLSRCRISNISDESKISKIEYKTSRHYTQSKMTNCWNCHKPMDIYTGGSKESFFCSSCGSLQDVNVNYVSEWTLGQNIVKITVNKFCRITLHFSESLNNFESIKMS